MSAPATAAQKQADPQAVIQVHERAATPPLPISVKRSRNSYSWQTELGRRRVLTLCTSVLDTEHEGQVHTPLSHPLTTPTLHSCCFQPDIPEHMPCRTFSPSPKIKKSKSSKTLPSLCAMQNNLEPRPLSSIHPQPRSSCRIDGPQR